VEIRRIDASEAQAFEAWFVILRLTDQECWKDVPGWDERVVRAFAEERGGASEFHLLSAVDQSGSTLGIGYMELPQRDNRHTAGLDIRIHPDHRRRGIGSAMAAEIERRALDDGRTVLNCLIEVPTHMVGTEPSAAFARSLGFEATQYGNRRSLSLPTESGRLSELRHEVARASSGYRALTFVGPWPAEFVEDQCEMERRMSTDQPQGDVTAEEQVWDAVRIAEMDALLAVQGLTKLSAVAQHIETGRLVAFTQIVISEARPTEAWQWATLVLKEHRGHRLGLAVKLANLDQLAAVLPSARRVITGNAQSNAPMIAVNDMLGFEVVGTGTFWQKRLGP
jgi:GNAT superfamily N-acetyltransferase